MKTTTNPATTLKKSFSANIQKLPSSYLQPHGNWPTETNELKSIATNLKLDQYETLETQKAKK
jgi:hypothetical protein